MLMITSDNLFLISSSDHVNIKTSDNMTPAYPQQGQNLFVFLINRIASPPNLFK